MRILSILLALSLGACVDQAATPDIVDDTDAGPVPTDNGNACEEGDVDGRACAGGGTQERACQNGAWTAWGSCDTSCADGDSEENTCGEGAGTRERACVDGMWTPWTDCAIDPESLWQVVLVNAELPRGKPDGSSWDAFNSEPDPFAEVLIISDDGPQWSNSSEPLDNTLNPAWSDEDGVVLTGIPAADIDYLRIEILDSDFGGLATDDVGACRPFESAPIHFTGELTQCTLPTANGNLVVRYRLERIE